MIHLTKRTLNDIFTGPDGQTFAVGRISGVVTLVTGLALPFWSIAKGQAPDWSALGVYVGALVTSTTALITFTNKTEPPAPPPAD